MYTRVVNTGTTPTFALRHYNGNDIVSGITPYAVPPDGFAQLFMLC